MSTLYPLRSCPLCGEMHRRLFPLCAKHERRMQRYGSPTGNAIRTEELIPYRQIAAGLLRTYATERAVVAIHGLMQAILDRYGADCEYATPGRKVRPLLDILQATGATARSSLTELLAVALFWQLGELQPSRVEMELQLARRLMLHTRKGGLSRKVNCMTRKPFAGLGWRIVSDVLPTLFQMSAHYMKVVKAHDEQRLAAREFAPTF